MKEATQQQQQGQTAWRRRLNVWREKLSTHCQRGWLMKSPNHWAAFSQSATGLRGCEFEWAGLALAGHLTSKGSHGNVKGEKKGGD